MAKLDNLGAYAASLATNLHALGVPQYINANAFRVSRKRNAILHMVLGDYEPGDKTGEMPSFKNLRKFGGNGEYRWTIQIGLSSAIAGVARGGTAHKASATRDIANNLAGAMYGPVAEYAGKHWLGTDEIALLNGSNGSPQTAQSLLGNYIIDSWESILGTAVNATGASAAPAADVCGSIWYATSDGLSASGESDHDVYCGLKRSETLNADARSYVDYTSKVLDATDVQRLKMKVVKAGGSPKAIVTTEDLWLRLWQISSSMSQYTPSDENSNVAFDWFKFGTSKVMWDHRAPTGNLLVTDPDIYQVVTHEVYGPMSIRGMMPDPLATSADVIMFNSWIQVFNLRPWQSAKATNKS